MNAIDPARTALLLMDFQADILARLGDRVTGAVERAAGLAAWARATRLPIVHVTVGFRPGYPEIDRRNVIFNALAESGRWIVSTPGADIAPALRPADGDVVVVKHRANAFFATDLDMILRARGIDTLILAGIVTSGVVLSTLRHAADADYRLVVVEDGCADADDEVHRVLMQKVFVRQAAVVAARELIQQ